MVFTVPNEADATHADQAELHSRDIDMLVLAYGGTGVVSGCAVTAQGSPDTTVAVAAGAVISDGVYAAVTAGNVTMTAADATNPRFDLVSASSAGVKTWTAGTAGTNPTPPIVPSGHAPLAVVYVPANDNIVNSTQIIDKRIIIRDRGATTLLVAASDAKATTKAVADYVCDGTNDQTDILAALTALPAFGGTVQLSEGTFSWNGQSADTLRSNMTLRGMGMGRTVIQLATGSNSRLWYNTDSNPETGVTFEDLTFDGNMVNQTDGASRDERSGLTFTSVDDLHFVRVETKNFRSGASIRLYACDGVEEVGCYYHDNGLQAATTGSHVLPVTTLNVASTTGFASAGKLKIGTNTITYTGKTGTTFTGVSGGTGTAPASTPVYPVTNDANAFLLICDAVFHGTCQNVRVTGILAVNNSDTGTALDGVVRGSIVGNIYVTNALGVGMGFSNAETGGSADSCEDITVQSCIITGLNNTFTENQGLKCADFGNTGDGGNNKRLRFLGNVIRLCDRAVWVDDTDDLDLSHNHFLDAVGPNGQLTIIATSGQSVNGLRIEGNVFGNTANRAISFDTGTKTRVQVLFNEFKSDVTTAIDGTLPTGSDWITLGNKGYGSDANKTGLTFIIDGGGATITTGVKGDVRVPFDCTVIGWDALADQSGSIVVDVWRDTYANYPPVVGDSIAGSEKPTITTATKNQDATLTTWTTALVEGDVLRFNVDSVTTIQRVAVCLYLRRK